MFLRMLAGSLARRKRRFVVVMLAIAIGSGVATALVSVAAGFGDRLLGELRQFGANIVIMPAEEKVSVALPGFEYRPPSEDAYIDERELAQLKGRRSFWRNNILNFVPFLYVDASINGGSVTLAGTWFDRGVAFDTGITERIGAKHVCVWWTIEGAWPQTPDEALVGRRAAEKLKVRGGDVIRISKGTSEASLKIVGVVTAGGAEDDMVIANVETAQRISGLASKVKRVYVSAMTTPDEAAARLRKLDPMAMNPEEYERFVCTPTAASIAHRLEQTMSGVKAEPVRRISEAETTVFLKLRGMFVLLAAAAVVAAALGVMSTMTASIVERRKEIGLLKAMGATAGSVAGLIVCEVSLVGFIGGVAGCGIGAVLGSFIGNALFGQAVVPGAAVGIVAIGSSIAIGVLGAALPLRRAIAVRPASVLHEA